MCVRNVTHQVFSFVCVLFFFSVRVKSCEHLNRFRKSESPMLSKKGPHGTMQSEAIWMRMFLSLGMRVLSKQITPLRNLRECTHTHTNTNARSMLRRCSKRKSGTAVWLLKQAYGARVGCRGDRVRASASPLVVLFDGCAVDFLPVVVS